MSIMVSSTRRVKNYAAFMCAIATSDAIPLSRITYDVPACRCNAFDSVLAQEMKAQAAVPKAMAAAFRDGNIASRMDPQFDA